MKEFVKYVLATIVGLFLFGIIMIAVGAMSIVGMISSGQATKNVKENSVLVLNLEGTMDERSGDNMISQFTKGALDSPGLEETLNAVKKAKDNDDIKGIYIEAGAFSTDYASAQELRNALDDFKKSGKWIIAYADAYTQGTYYLSSVASKVYLNPSGMVDWHGLGAEPMFVKDLLAKFGIKMQVVKVGKFKSATEMFTEDKMSDASRLQTQVYINGLWANMCKGVSDSRKISVALLNQYADSLMTFNDPKVLVKKHIVDGLLYTDQVKKEVKKLLKLDDDETINQVSVEDMQNVKDKQDGDEIAVYYAYGNIVDSPLEGGIFGSEHMIVGKDVCKDLEKLMNDDDVKAVVVRINSGGGSAYASEQIWHQIAMLKTKKPVVVSMGGMAASGGYYMSCNANWIVAEPTTLTGSIGIFGMIPDRSQLLTQKLCIKFDEVKTNKNSTFGTPARPMNAEEIAYLTQYIDRGYSLFRQRVADGRKLTVAQVQEIAQGHVFLGQDALKIKLVDELGGIDKAIAKAGKLAKLTTYYTENYPELTSMFDQLMTVTQGGNYLDDQMRIALGDYYEPFMLLKSMNQQSAIQARIPVYFNIK
jgi:protease-4